jgi:hypothetical protein
MTKITGSTSDGYHTFDELYEYRMLYNAALFNEWARLGRYDVHKSYHHSDGSIIFGGGYFIVVAELPTGQISNHYENVNFLLFNVPVKEIPNNYDGHTPNDVAHRLTSFLILNVATQLKYSKSHVTHVTHVTDVN